MNVLSLFDGMSCGRITLSELGIPVEKYYASEVVRIRRLTPTECARLQTIPEWYIWDGISDTQRYKMLGNGWNIETIKHIFKYIKQ